MAGGEADGRPDARLVEKAGGESPESRAFAGGRVVLYSAPSPDKEGAPNEDAAAILPLGPKRGVLAVADGLGGQPHGHTASAVALRSLEEALREGASGSEESLRGAILDGVERANAAVRELGLGGATTLMVAEIVGRTLRAYHVGDSALVVTGQRGRLRLQTIPHSPVGYAVESGLLDAEEALHHDERHLISNIVGSPDMRIEVGSPLALAARDTVLLATDGLFDNLAVEEVVRTVRCGPLERAAAALAERCGERMRRPREGEPSKPDDLTFLLFRAPRVQRGRARR